MLRGRDRASAVATFKPPGRDETAREKAGWRVRRNVKNLLTDALTPYNK